MRLAVVGANGRMGQEILLIASADKKIKSLIGVSRSGKAKGFQKSVKALTKDLAETIDIVIDFSLPENFNAVLEFCEQHKLALVSGVTGLSSGQVKAMNRVAKKTPVLWASNMSLGVAILRRALKSLGDIGDFDAQIIEWHHRNKKDNPSGTAKTLHEDLKRLKAGSLSAPIGIRGGGIPGIHRVCLMAANETLVFEHQALSRSVFAFGALRAAHWLVKKQPGLYSMDEVLV